MLTVLFRYFRGLEGRGDADQTAGGEGIEEAKQEGLGAVA